MKLTPKTSIHELFKNHPFLVDFLVAYNPRYSLLKNRVMRATMARVASMKKVARIGEIELAELLEAIRAEIEKQTGQSPEVDLGGADLVLTEPERVAAMKQLIQDLHDGASFEDAKAVFDDLIQDVAPDQIAAMEQQLIKEGLPVAEVTRLCDLHVGVFKEGLEANEELTAPEGHPVHTFMADNQILQGLASDLDTELKKEHPDLVASTVLLSKLAGLDNHYVRKENQLFPYLEKHEITGPSQVMWALHNEIRAQLKQVRVACKDQDMAKLKELGAALSLAVTEMIYKEEKILFPMSLEKLSQAEWAQIRAGEAELGYDLAKPAAEWPSDASEIVEVGGQGAAGDLDLSTGKLPLAALDAILTHLPVDLSFVDPNGHVKYYSDNPERIFPRSPAVIGRHVENCHPPGSVDKVKAIMKAFAEGSQNKAEFWIQLGEKFLYIRYFAVHDRAGTYLGCLEVSQDVTEIRKLKGEQRLVSWDS